MFFDLLKIVEDEEICECYGKVLGSVVNFVLCEGNLDCCVLIVVKNYVCKYLYLMGEWF